MRKTDVDCGVASVILPKLMKNARMNKARMNKARMNKAIINFRSPKTESRTSL